MVVIRRGLALVGFLLVVFHGWLFAGQIFDGQLADAALVLRWLIAAGLILGLRQIHRSGTSIFFSRRGVAMWLLAALLHGPALAERNHITVPAVPEAVAVLAKASLGLVAGAGLVLLLGLALVGRRRQLRPFARRTVVVSAPLGSPAISIHPLFAPRPPPIV